MEKQRKDGDECFTCRNFAKPVNQYILKLCGSHKFTGLKKGVFRTDACFNAGQETLCLMMKK